MLCKYCFYIKDFPDVVEYYKEQVDIINDKISQLIKDNQIFLSLNNPTISYYIANSLIVENEVSLDKITSVYNSNLNLNFSTNLNVFDEKIFFQEYNLDLITALSEIFLSLEENTFSVNWFYKSNIDKANFYSDGEIIVENIPYIQLLDNFFYRSKNETFNNIKITNKNESPVKSNLEFYLNKKEDKTIICGINEIKAADLSFYFNNYNDSYVSNDIALHVDNLSQTKVNQLLLNRNNISIFLPNNLDVENYTYSSVEYDDNPDYVLSVDDFKKLNKKIKDLNDYEIDSDYKIHNSYSETNALNYNKAAELIILTIDKIYTSIVQTKALNLELTESDKIYALYKQQVSDYKNNYVFSSNSVITSYCSETNYCKEVMLPLTLQEQQKCVDGFVHIEDTEKALTKGDYKKWMKQCLKSRIYV